MLEQPLPSRCILGSPSTLETSKSGTPPWPQKNKDRRTWQGWVMRVLVIGGDATGMSSASQLKRRLGEAVDITVLNDQRWTSYSACGIPYWVAGEVAGGPESLVARSPEKHRDNGLDVRVGVRATVINPHQKQVSAVEIADSATSMSFDYDHLIVATGAGPLQPPIPGIDLPGVLRTHTLDDGLIAIDALEQMPRTAVVVGAGFIGVEMAEACVQRGLETVVLDLAPEPMAVIDTDMGALITESMKRHGVTFKGQEPATEFIAGPDGRVSGVRTANGTYPADIVFLGLGVRPRTELAVAAGLPVGRSGGIQIDDHCRVQGYENIWAGGDCVENHHRVSGEPAYIPLGTHANKHGRVIGLNLSGEDAVFPGIVGTAITKFMSTEIARVGLTEQQAERLDRNVATATISTTTKAGYFSDSESMHVKIVVDRDDGRVLGGQIVGGVSAGKRIDSAATAVWSSMTASEVLDLDLSYAPPFSGVWDPFQIAARRVLGKLD